MRIKLTPTFRAFIKDLQAQADERNMMVDWETQTIVPFPGYVRQWPQGDRVPEDYEPIQPKEEYEQTVN